MKALSPGLLYLKGPSLIWKGLQMATKLNGGPRKSKIASSHMQNRYRLGAPCTVQ